MQFRNHQLACVNCRCMYFKTTSIPPVLTLRQHISVYKLELKYIQTKTTKRWLPACNLAIKAQHITMQTNCMIWEILFSDIDLNIFKNKRKNVMPRYRKKNSWNGTLSNYIPMFFFLNNYIATPLISIQ
jgi:hypothetical protein